MWRASWIIVTKQSVRVGVALVHRSVVRSGTVHIDGVAGAQNALWRSNTCSIA